MLAGLAHHLAGLGGPGADAAAAAAAAAAWGFGRGLGCPPGYLPSSAGVASHCPAPGSAAAVAAAAAAGLHAPAHFPHVLALSGGSNGADASLDSPVGGRIGSPPSTAGKSPTTPRASPRHSCLTTYLLVPDPLDRTSSEAPLSQHDHQLHELSIHHNNNNEDSRNNNHSVTEQTTSGKGNPSRTPSPQAFTSQSLTMRRLSHRRLRRHRDRGRPPLVSPEDIRSPPSPEVPTVVPPASSIPDSSSPVSDSERVTVSSPTSSGTPAASVPHHPFPSLHPALMQQHNSAFFSAAAASLFMNTPLLQPSTQWLYSHFYPPGHPLSLNHFQGTFQGSDLQNAMALHLQQQRNSSVLVPLDSGDSKHSNSDDDEVNVNGHDDNIVSAETSSADGRSERIRIVDVSGEEADEADRPRASSPSSAKPRTHKSSSPVTSLRGRATPTKLSTRHSDVWRPY